jgi:hypothetical protein
MAVPPEVIIIPVGMAGISSEMKAASEGMATIPSGTKAVPRRTVSIPGW